MKTTQTAIPRCFCPRARRRRSARAFRPARADRELHQGQPLCYRDDSLVEIIAMSDDSEKLAPEQANSAEMSLLNEKATFLKPEKPRKKRRRKRLPNFLRSLEIVQLIEAARVIVLRVKSTAKRAAAERDLAMVQTGLYLGLRVSEMCNLHVEEIDLEGRTCFVVLGKGGKDRNVPIGVKAHGILVPWLAGRTTGFVFPGRGGRRLAVRTAQRRVTALGVAAGLQRRLKCHTLRHTFATGLLEAGANLSEVQELLGHESLATTERYIHVLPERLRAAVDRL